MSDLLNSDKSNLLFPPFKRKNQFTPNLPKQVRKSAICPNLSPLFESNRSQLHSVSTASLLPPPSDEPPK